MPFAHAKVVSPSSVTSSRKLKKNSLATSAPPPFGPWPEKRIRLPFIFRLSPCAFPSTIAAPLEMTSVPSFAPKCVTVRSSLSRWTVPPLSTKSPW